MSGNALDCPLRRALTWASYAAVGKTIKVADIIMLKTFCVHLGAASILGIGAVTGFSQTPFIFIQPQSQNVAVGADVSFSVTAANAGAPLPPVSSGTLSLWLKADTGVATNANGQVSQWRDQSGNTNDALQSNSNLQPKLVTPANLNGMPAVRFDGIANTTFGDCMQGSGNVGLSNAYTSFMLYLLRDPSTSKQVPAYVGYGTTSGDVRAYFVYNQEMRWGTYYYDYGNHFIVPTNTYRIATHRLNTNENFFQQFDATATSSSSFSLVPNNSIVTPPAGYGLGALNTPFDSGFNFAGDIAELIYFRGSLSDSDRQAVETYLKQKYLLLSAQGPFTYQWLLNNTNITDATNTTLTLSNVQISDAGIYSVIVTAASGSTTSSNAVLNVGIAPSIATQPVGQTVVQSNTVAFSVVASGTDPLSYQWYFNGSAMAQQTSPSLSFTNVQPASSGAYSVVVSNIFGSATSSNAVLQVDAPPQMTSQPQTVMAAVGSTATITANAMDGAAPTLPAISSGTLRLWLKADAGVVANSSAQVSVWRDQSGNANDASQPNSAQQPVVVYPIGGNGQPVLRFDGIESSTTGDFLQGTGDVGLSNAFTAFLYYAENSTLDSYGYGKDIAMVGVPNPSFAGTGRGFAVINNYLTFTTWGNDYQTSVNLPIGSYRIATQRFNTNQNVAEVFDRTITSSNGFTFSTSGQSIPSAGFYVGGLGSQIRNFGGDVGELIYFSGALNDSDRLAVERYLQQKYYQAAVTTGLSYQWQFNGTDLPGQTSSSLVISNVQFSDAGSYNLVVTNTAGSTTSSNAVVIVGLTPSISAQPQNQAVPVGTLASFAATASGTDPLSYQWKFNGTAIALATSSMLSITNAQTTNNGSYTVVITNLFGAVTSSNATLRVDVYPQILMQPQSQTVTAGNNSTFSVGTDAVLPAITSGTLRLWLKGDAGVITNSNNQVSQWTDQSPNGNNARQANSSQQPILVRPAAINGRPALRFDGIQSSSTGDYLVGTNDVGIPDAYTSFVVAEPSSFSSVNVAAFVGAPGTVGAARGYALISGQLYLTTWNNDYNTGFSPSAGTYRIWTERFNTNRTFAEMFDRTSSASSNFSWTVSSIQTPSAGYYIGGLGAFIRSFGGDIAEVIYYKGSLSDSDRLAVETYLRQKYYQAIPLSGLTYQWQLNGSNITDATNSSLTISNAQPANAGTYTVTVCNGSACITGSNATLTVNIPPSITQQPVGQSVIVGTSASFSANGDGTAPLSYQWQHNGANISGATTTSLSIASAQQSDAGSYALVVSSPYGSATSSSAVLGVITSTVIAGNVSASGSSTVSLPILLSALGNENAVGFSLNFDPTLLSVASVNVGSNLTAATVFYNTANSGHAGIAVSLSSGNTFAVGAQEMVVVVFNVGLVATNVVTPISFGDTPTLREISDPSPKLLPGTYIAGSVTLTATAFEGDVSPRPGGDQRVGITDWVQVGRFVAGLDTVSSPSEFQRVDCAPRNGSGNGKLTVSDWVQAGRYFIGLDPLTPVGGPTTPIGNAIVQPRIPTSRTIALQTGTTSGITNVVSVQLNAQGDESAVGFSLSFDYTQLRFTGASVGSSASGASMNVNSVQATNGTLGVALELPFGQSFPAGTQEVVRLNFVPIVYAPGSSNITFTDWPVIREVSDATANSLSANYVNSTVATTGLLPLLSITQDGAGNVTLSWTASANGYGLESVSDLATNWLPVSASVVTNGANVFVIQSAATNQLYFRLRHP